MKTAEELVNDLQNAKTEKEVNEITSKLDNLEKAEREGSVNKVNKIENKKTDNYSNVFYKKITNKKLNKDEENLINKVIENNDNDFEVSEGGIIAPYKFTAMLLGNKGMTNFDTTGSTSGEVADTETDWSTLEVVVEEYGFFGAIKKTLLPKLVKMVFYDGVVSGEAGVYLEDECMDSEVNAFSEKVLEYFSIGKYVEMSQLLKVVSQNQFERFFYEEIVENVKGKLGRLVTMGTGGKLGESGRVTPSGIITETINTANPDTIVDYVSVSGITQETLEKAEAKLLKMETNAKWYCNKMTLLNVKSLKDGIGHKLYQTYENGNLVVEGREMIKDISIPDGIILLCDASRVYAMNFMQGLTLEFDKDIRCQKNQISAYTIADGGVIRPKEVVLIKPDDFVLSPEVAKRNLSLNLTENKKNKK